MSGHPLPASEEARGDELPEPLAGRKGKGDDMPEQASAHRPVAPDGTPYAAGGTEASHKPPAR